MIYYHCQNLFPINCVIPIKWPVLLKVLLVNKPITYNF